LNVSNETNSQADLLYYRQHCCHLFKLGGAAECQVQFRRGDVIDLARVASMMINLTAIAARG
jgi:hypothetical protein